MELSLREKIALQRQVKEGLDKLKAGVANLRDRIALQRQVKEGLDKLKGVHSAEAKTDYQRLLDGEFNHLPWQQFYDKMVEICSNEGLDCSAAKEPAANYLRAHFDMATGTYKEAA